MLVKKEPDMIEGAESPSTDRRNPSVVVIMILLLFITLPVAYIFLSEHNIFGDKNAKKARPLPLVTVAKSSLMDVPVQLKAIAHVEPMQTVAVRTRVDGEIIAVLFKEGDYVNQGASLFQIDPRPFTDKVKQCQADLMQGNADVKQAEALLAKDRADLRKLYANMEGDQAKESYAKKQWSRYADLVKQGAVSLDQEEQLRSTADAMNATMKADQATIDNQKAVIQSDLSKVEGSKAKLSSLQVVLDNAHLELSYCLVRSPMGGRAGGLMVHLGDMVKQHSDNPLVVINQVKPINVAFSIPEQELADVALLQKNKNLLVDILPTKNTATGNTAAQDTAAKNAEPIKGELSFLDNTVEKATGMIALKAKVPNTEDVLWAGQYVTAVLNLRTIHNAVVVPNRALQIGQKGSFIYVIKPDMSAEMRNVKVERHYKDMAVISEGLQSGETVVVDGQLQLTPGAKVTIADTDFKAEPKIE